MFSVRGAAKSFDVLANGPWRSLWSIRREYVVYMYVKRPIPATANRAVDASRIFPAGLNRKRVRPAPFGTLTFISLRFSATCIIVSRKAGRGENGPERGDRAGMRRQEP